MIKDIDKQLGIIENALKWGEDFNRQSFPVEQFKEWRRKLRRIKKALQSKIAAAAYGESQVGKSYLMSSLLSSADSPFVIENKGEKFSFIDDLNASGGRNSQIETTGVITRFTIRKDYEKPEGTVKIINLSVPDIILLLVDSYYNDIKIGPDSILTAQQINEILSKLKEEWQGRPTQQNIIEEDDVKDIMEYIHDIIANSASPILQSNFGKEVTSFISKLPYDKWVEVFSLLWNRNSEMSRLFSTLINAYKKIDFNEIVYVPFEAVEQKYGTLLKIEWLDTICGIQVDTGSDIVYTDVYDKNGRLLAKNYSKGDLSALIAEICFEVPDELARERGFLQEMDLLDFPGARSREKYKDKEIAKVLPRMLRRGKVAYLFNKYSRARQINSVLFCHHDSQKTEPTIGETINNWINDIIGESPEERTKTLNNTGWISPLFLIATKFNKDIERIKTDNPGEEESLEKHWNRFDTVLPEIIKPNRWLEEWIDVNGVVKPFQDIYPLRDFYYSAKNGLFEGFSDKGKISKETRLIIPEDYPDYYDRLKESFLRNKFVRKHFSNPEQTWESVATLNNDGSKMIISKLNQISGTLDKTRRDKYREELEKIKAEMLGSLNVFFEPDDLAAKNLKVRTIAGDIRRSLMHSVSTDPAKFGNLIDNLMVSPEAVRNIVYDIIIRHTAAPVDYNYINFIRAVAEVDLSQTREYNISKLLNHFIFDSEEQLCEHLAQQGYDLEDFISKTVTAATSMGDVIASHILGYWSEFLNGKTSPLSEIIPHVEEVVFMLVSLFEKMNLRSELSSRINVYREIFSETEQLNAIADYAALMLNNFVSTVGRNHIPESEISELKNKAEICRLPIDFSATGMRKVRKRQSVEETLRIFDGASKIINHGTIDMTLLRKLPFWDNYQRWENFLMIGLLYASDISRCDPVANERIKQLINESASLYN